MVVKLCLWNGWERVTSWHRKASQRKEGDAIHETKRKYVKDGLLCCKSSVPQLNYVRSSIHTSTRTSYFMKSGCQWCKICTHTQVATTMYESLTNLRNKYIITYLDSILNYDVAQQWWPAAQLCRCKTISPNQYTLDDSWTGGLSTVVPHQYIHKQTEWALRSDAQETVPNAQWISHRGWHLVTRKCSCRGTYVCTHTSVYVCMYILYVLAETEMVLTRFHKAMHLYAYVCT